MILKDYQQGAPQQGYNPNQYGQQQQYQTQPAQPGYGYQAQQPAGYAPAPAQPYGAAPYGQPAAQQNPDAELWSWFKAVDTDNSGKISVTELQAALTNANWTTFNAETCRLMIGKNHSICQYPMMIKMFHM